MTFIPTAELVAVAWVSNATPIPSAGVATTLPEDGKWPNGQFVQVSVVGGTPAPDTPLYQPVVTFDCWAMRETSARPPWNKANQLAEMIRHATYKQRSLYRPHPAVLVPLPAGYQTAQVLSMHPVSEPRRILSDPSAYARYSQDILLHWAPVELVIA